MRPFAYRRAESPAAAVQAASRATAQYLAGGTNILDYMKLDVSQPETLIDINDLERDLGQIDASARGLHLGALVRMADAAEHLAIRHDYPVIAQSLGLAASQQLRNMASLGGNVLQRTRCQYFRTTNWHACNKRDPGSGCAAIGGVNRKHAVLGASDKCIATYPGDFAQALVALDATVELLGLAGPRTIRFEELHRLPGTTPHIETSLASGELITGFFVPAGPWARRSLYLKVRDRESYEFAIASAAVALDLDGGIVRQARIGLGGVATKPWRAREAEEALTGQRLTEDSATRAAEAAFAGAQTHGANAYKPELGRRTLVRALLQAANLEI
jgi:xanthine dehydrogenase YagS FAD-binding subunit